jgi:hypothetical protein
MYTLYYSKININQVTLLTYNRLETVKLKIPKNKTRTDFLILIVYDFIH